MRIIYVQAPSTPLGYLPRALTFTLAAILLLLILGYALHYSPDTFGAVSTFFYVMLKPLMDPVLLLSGAGTSLPPQVAGVYTMFLLAFVRTLFLALPMMQLKLREISQLDHAYGPLTRPMHRSWFIAFIGAALLMFALYSVRLTGSDSLVQAIFITGLRLALWLGLAVAAVCWLIIGLRLQRSWHKGGGAPKPKATTSPLKLVVDNSNMPLEKPEPQGIYIALTAGLIQSAGRLGQMPSGTDLLTPLQTLAQAAQASRSGGIYDGDLASLCEQTAALFAAGGLRALPDLKAAQKLFAKADKDKLAAIAFELQEKLGNMPRQ